MSAGLVEWYPDDRRIVSNKEWRPTSEVVEWAIRNKVGVVWRYERHAQAEPTNIRHINQTDPDLHPSDSGTEDPDSCLSQVHGSLLSIL